MAAITQIKLDSTSTTYDINDKRITTTAITTCTHVLASSSSSLTSIAPITAANLASVLGVLTVNVHPNPIAQNSDLNNFTAGVYHCQNASVCSTLTNVPSEVSGNFRLIVIYNTSNSTGWWGWQFLLFQEKIFFRFHDATYYKTWKQVELA